MTNKTIANLIIIGWATLFCAGFLSVFPEQEGMYLLLAVIGYPMYFIFSIWGIVRLYKS